MGNGIHSSLEFGTALHGSDGVVVSSLSIYVLLINLLALLSLLLLG
jgi:hypothetical protein